MKDGYKTVRLKEALVKAAQEYIRQHPELGYPSLASFVADAVREKLQELQRQEVAADA